MWWVCRKLETCTQEEPSRHNALLSIWLAIHSLDIRKTAYSKLLLHLKSQTRQAYSAECCLVYPAPQTAVPLNGCTGFTAARVRQREEGGAVMQWYRGQPDKSRSPHVLGYYLQPITSLLLFRDLLGVPINLKCYCYPYRKHRMGWEGRITHSAVCL